MTYEGTLQTAEKITEVNYKVLPWSEMKKEAPHRISQLGIFIKLTESKIRALCCSHNSAVLCSKMKVGFTSKIDIANNSKSGSKYEAKSGP